MVTCLCPEGFERHGVKCYKAVGLLASWTEAKVRHPTVEFYTLK